MTVISASDLDPVADDSLNHKSVLEVTNAVALLCLASLNTWKREEDTFRKTVLILRAEVCSAHNTSAATVQSESAAVIPANHIHICTREGGGEGGVCCIISKAFTQIKGSNDRDITHVHHYLLLHSVWTCPLHYE